MASDHIPQELFFEILKRLPAKTICRFQSVSKSWGSLISSSYFSKTHLTFHSAATNKPKTHLRRYLNRCMIQPQLDEDNISCIVPLLKFPVPPYTYVDLLDVIHGVVFYTYSSLHYVIGFWNPSIRRHVSAHLPPEALKKTRGLLGAGYDASNNDLKAVWVPHSEKGGADRYYKVFSVRTGAWKRREWTLPCGAGITKGYDGSYFNGTVYWVTDRDEVNDRHALLYFDCESEEFGRMELPVRIRDVYGNPTVFVNSATGLLSLLVAEWGVALDSTDIVLYICGLWTMKEYGVWTKDFTVRCSSTHLAPINKTYLFHESMLLLNNGESCVCE